tara:strand:- start:32 stop:298 length:267 start_codon:yes stop_codon:yes gene_type:complete
MENKTNLALNENTTCFSAHKSCKKSCSVKDCRYWIDHESTQNCTIIASEEGPMTLQQIGEIFGVTRMRICQIEKTILKKLVTHTKEVR